MRSSCLFLFTIYSCLVVSIYAWPDFRLYTRGSPNNYVTLTNNLLNTPFSYSIDTVLLVHGFGSSGDTDTMYLIKNEILKSENKNVVIVDWKQGAAMPDYFAATRNVKVTGNAIGDFLQNNNISPKRVHCIGHSLGAHVCGFAGKRGALKRISGLDPAGPNFGSATPENRLDKKDATLVDCIHTDSKYGIQISIGHKDFYPNGGKGQPGCLLKDLASDFENDTWKGDFISCSHSRATLYYSESVNSKCAFTARKCSSYADYNGSCNTCVNGCSRMGYHADKSADQGQFFLITGKAEPFCQN